MVRQIRNPARIRHKRHFACHRPRRGWHRFLRKEPAMKIQTVTAYLLIIVLTAPVATATQRRDPPEVWRSFAERLEPGAFVRVRLIDHKQVKGHLIMVDGDTL